MTKPGGKVVADVAAARAAGALELHFRDGIVDAKVERPARARYDPPAQETLF